MKRSPIILALALSALVACGDNGEVTGPDDVGEQTASITVSRAGAPVADHVVLIHDQDGNLVAEATTDRAGTVRFDVAELAAVTVATELGNLVTIAGIRAGDSVAWSPEQEAQRQIVGTVAVTASGAADLSADQFRYMACGRTETGTDPQESVSIAVDNPCLRGNGDLSVFAVASTQDEVGATQLLAFTGRRRLVPKIGENTVVNFGAAWSTDWNEIPIATQRPAWGDDDGRLTARASVVFEGYDYALPAVSASEGIKFPTGYDDQRVAALTWAEDTGFGAIARSSQWFNPDRNTPSASWPTPPTILNTTFEQGRVIMSWDGKLGNAVATEIAWTSNDGFKTWTLVDRGDVSDTHYPELTGTGSFVGPGNNLTGARAIGIYRGTTGYSALLQSGVAGELVWDSALRRSVASGAGVQLTEIQSTGL
jgi:hypothetical protein